MAKDTPSVINVACQDRREALSATRSLQRTRSSVILNEEYYECNTDKNEASNPQNTRTQGIDRTTVILKKSIFVLMTLLSLSILVTQGSVCISK